MLTLERLDKSYCYCGPSPAMASIMSKEISLHVTKKLTVSHWRRGLPKIVQYKDVYDWRTSYMSPINHSSYHHSKHKGFIV